MRPRARLRLLGGGASLLALLGLWLGHTLEYVRVWGVRGLITELFGSVHAYMLPFALVLGVLAAICSVRGYRLWLRLGRRVDAARAAIGSAWRGEASPPPQRQALPSGPARLFLAWPVLTAAQVSLYVLQENLEALRAGLPAPGLTAITGVHALAPVMHALVALGLLVLLAAFRLLFLRRVIALRAVEAVLNGILARLGGAIAARQSAHVTLPAPHLVASHCLRRPPPAAALI